MSERGSTPVDRDETRPDAGARDLCPTREIAGRSVVTRRIADETILVPVAGDVGDLDSVYTLNGVGSFIWHRIDGRTPAAVIALAVCDEFEVTAEQAARDVEEFVAALISRGLVRLADAEGRG